MQKGEFPLLTSASTTHFGGHKKQLSHTILPPISKVSLYFTKKHIETQAAKLARINNRAGCTQQRSGDSPQVSVHSKMGTGSTEQGMQEPADNADEIDEGENELIQHINCQTSRHSEQAQQKVLKVRLPSLNQNRPKYKQIDMDKVFQKKVKLENIQNYNKEFLDKCSMSSGQCNCVLCRRVFGLPK